MCVGDCLSGCVFAGLRVNMYVRVRSNIICECAFVSVSVALFTFC